MISLAAEPGAVDVATPGPLIVELAGAPGAGKTTAVPGVLAALRDAGWEAFTPEEAARAVVARMALGRLVARLPNGRMRNALWWRLYLAHRLAGSARAIAANPRHFAWVAARQRRRPAGAETRRRRVLHWYLRTAGSQEFFRRHGADGEAVVYDEGQVHRVVQLFSSPVDQGADEEVHRYLGAVPEPDLVVIVGCSAASSLDRVRDRGVWPRLGHLSAGELERFVSNAHHVSRLAARHAVSSGWRVAEIDNEGDATEALADRVADAVTSSIPVAADTAAVRNHLLYRVHLPTPGRLTRMARGRVTPPSIGLDTLDILLDQYGIRRTGRVTNLPLGRRSDSVVVPSDAGRLVVRAYSDHWLADTIRHEHSVLKHLRAFEYPAARLVATTDGETVHTVNGKRMVLFNFAPGANLSGSFLSARTALEATHLAGRLLARLHAVTAGLRPDGSHHLAMDDTDGGSRLAAQLAVLEELTAAPARHPDAVWLNNRVPAMAHRLAELHEMLMNSDLEISVIHGDFGLHNILLGRDGSATVHDFELARRDWRLVDIVESVARYPARVRMRFLTGYRLEWGGEPPDWRHLGEMWEYHRLGGAVRSWESFVARNDFKRLVVARARVEEAERIAAEGVGDWW